MKITLICHFSQLSCHFRGQVKSLGYFIFRLKPWPKKNTTQNIPRLNTDEHGRFNRFILINTSRTSFCLPRTSYQLAEQIWLLSAFSTTHAQVYVLIDLARLLRFSPADWNSTEHIVPANLKSVLQSTACVLIKYTKRRWAEPHRFKYSYETTTSACFCSFRPSSGSPRWRFPIKFLIIVHLGRRWCLFVPQPQSA